MSAPLVPWLRTRVLSTLTLFGLALMLADLLLTRWALGLTDSVVQTQFWDSLACYGSALVALAIFALLWLRPLARKTAVDDARVPGIALRFPALFALATLLALVSANLAKLAIDLGRSELVVAMLGLAGAMLAISLLLVALAFVSARGWMYPAIARLRSEQLPPGLRLSVTQKVTFALLAVALATTLPPAVAHFGRVEQLGKARFQRHRQQLVEVLAHGGKFLDGDQLAQTLASVDPSVARVRISAEQPSPSSGGWTTPLPSPHRGRLFLDSQRRQHVPAGFIISLVFGLLALASLIGLDLGRSIGGDLRLVSGRIDALLTQSGSKGAEDGDTVLASRAPQLRELQDLAVAVNDLLARIADINVGNFVAVERILEADQVKTQFLANMSHDLRSPLNSILGFAELLQRGMEGELNAGQRRAIDIARRNATELLHLINEVLDSAKVDAGRMAMHREDTLPAQFVTEALKRLRERGIPEGITIVHELQAGLPPMSVDGPRLSEALVYLLRFCIRELGEDGEIKLTARLTAQRDDSTAERNEPGVRRSDDRQLELLVIADAPPLSRQRLATLFDGFQRQPGHKGLGLGLPLARAFIERHGGQLEVASDEEGLRLRGLVPIRQQKALGRLRPVKI